MAGLAKAALAGDVRAAAQLMRDLDDRQPGALQELRELYPATGRAYVLGVTGNPGTGKSTVVDWLIERYRRQGQRVGVVAIDPTSPFSGGAILGDRIRMQRHSTDDGVFIRSLATRGHLGGLSRSTHDVVTVLDAMGNDVVIIETVGVGQDEVEVVAAAHTSIVITVPGLGDEVQAIKAGILEIADILVVNKAERDGADRTVRDLQGMLELRPREAPTVEVLRTVATRGEGIDELCAAIERHHAGVGAAQAAARRRQRAFAEVRDALRERLLEAAAAAAGPGGLEAIAAEVAARRTDPYSAAERLLAALRGTDPPRGAGGC
ncbi:MAG: methylmalonyl Co-A mutase-associated GTPase MeaB [Deltaproteobacteria bacterium]|nr:methylmalonyl Co-A mutase-associated GTPase MeaB [Deltaproteobacteria bacterium]